MRRIVDLPEEYVAALDRLRELEGGSPAALIRKAAEEYLSLHKRRSDAEKPGFGAWNGREIDAVAYQRKIRGEWEE